MEQEFKKFYCPKCCKITMTDDINCTSTTCETCGKNLTQDNVLGMSKKTKTSKKTTIKCIITLIISFALGILGYYYAGEYGDGYSVGSFFLFIIFAPCLIWIFIFGIFNFGTDFFTNKNNTPQEKQNTNQTKNDPKIEYKPISKPEQNIPRCPTCGCTNIKKLDSFDRGLSVFAWGLASSKIGKQFECLNPKCKYKW